MSRENWRNSEYATLYPFFLFKENGPCSDQGTNYLLLHFTIIWTQASTTATLSLHNQNQFGEAVTETL